MLERPYTLLSCALSLDGYLGSATPRRLVRNQFDCAPALMRAHRARREQGELDGLRLFRRRLLDGGV